MFGIIFPFAPSIGVTKNGVPEQTSAVISAISIVGLTVIVTVNVFPVQVTPLFVKLGVTVYTISIGAFEGFVNV